MNDNRHRDRDNDSMRWCDDYDVSRQRSISRNTNYENYYPYPAMDDHYRMYRDYNDRSHYTREERYGRNDGYPGTGMGGRAGYMEFDHDDDRNRTRISAYGYRNVGDRSSYGHSGTNDPYDPRYYDRGSSMYGMSAGSYPNARRDGEIRYESSDDWEMRGRDMGRAQDRDRDRSYREESIGRVHYDVPLNERNTSTWTGDRHMFNPYDDRSMRDERRRHDDGRGRGRGWRY